MSKGTKQETKKNKEVLTNDNKPNTFIFTKENYILTIASVLVIVLGFFLMSGNEDIYDFRKTTLAPIVVLLGFAIGGFAIFYKPKTKED